MTRPSHLTGEQVGPGQMAQMPLFCLAWHPELVSQAGPRR